MGLLTSKKKKTNHNYKTKQKGDVSFIRVRFGLDV